MASYSTTFDGSESPLSEGGVWQDGPGAWASMKKVSGATQPVVVGEQPVSRLATPTIGAAQHSEGTLAADADATDVIPYVATRIASSSDGDGYTLWVESATILTLYRVNDTGSLGFTQLGAAFTVSTMVSGTTFRLASTGSTHEVFRNGVSQGTRTDATYATGQPGHGGVSGTTLAGQLTAWVGGDGTSPPSPPVVIISKGMFDPLLIPQAWF